MYITLSDYVRDIIMFFVVSVPNSIVYIFTDADEKDTWKVDDVKSLAKEKQAELKFILTGTCGSTRKKRTPEVLICEYMYIYNPKFEYYYDAISSRIILLSVI